MEIREDEMGEYLVTYEGGNRTGARAPEQLRAAMAQWGAWFKELEAKGVLRNPGSALAPGGASIKRNGKGFVTDTTMAEVKELIGGFSMIAADSRRAGRRDRGGIAVPAQQPGPAGSSCQPGARAAGL